MNGSLGSTSGPQSGACYVQMRSLLNSWTAVRAKASDGGRTFTDLARRAQIAQCAAEAITEVGYADASMAEIARRAGVAKSVVSYHFSDKEGLMREVLRTALATYATIHGVPHGPGRRAFPTSSGPT